MIYVARNIKDRIAKGDNKFYMKKLDDGRIELIPAPDEVVEEGTPVNKELMQFWEDKLVWLLNRTFDEITSNTFTMKFDKLDGVEVESGVWNKDAGRIEC
jgi:hypothetical protein